MQKQHLKLIPPPEAKEQAPPAASESESEAPLMHLRITGRHGVFLLERGQDQIALVDARGQGAACTCGRAEGRHEGECEHVAILRACGFLQKAA